MSQEEFNILESVCRRRADSSSSDSQDDQIETTDQMLPDQLQKSKGKTLHTGSFVNRGKKRVRFSSTCKLIIFPKMKSKYEHKIWYQEEDFSNFKKSADMIVESIQSYDGSYTNVLAHLGIDCIYGLEKVISRESVLTRRRWRLSACSAVFTMQRRLRRHGVTIDFNGCVQDQAWSSWELIAKSYANAVTDSKCHAYELAQVYASNTPRDQYERMVSFLTSSKQDSVNISPHDMECLWFIPSQMGNHHGSLVNSIRDH